MAVLMLENGTVFEGEWFGAKHTCIGEVVFNTGMTGYQELLLDPAYCDQIVAMTYPLIGNDGIEVTVEFAKPALKAFIIRELCELPSSWVKIGKLEDFFEKNNICGLQGIDTRALTRIIRENPGMRGIITDKYPTEEQISEMRAFKSEGTVKKVTSKEKHEIDGDGAHVAVMDLGINQGVLKMLVKRNCRVTVFPATATAAEIMEVAPDGLLLTNGPGNPKDNADIIATVKELMGQLPMLGISLGHQIMALAAGGDTEMMKCGHRGCNQPVKDIINDRVYITSQNHGYAVAEDKLPANSIVSHINWNDHTVEGLKYTDIPAMSVQFCPEGSPGPQDTAFIFDDFIDMMKK